MAMRLLFAIWLLSHTAYADEAKLTLHLDCPRPAPDCVEIRFEEASSQTILIRRIPEMTLDPASVSEAELVRDESGRENLKLRLKPETAKKFGEVTGENIGRKLVVVVADKALIAPTIQSAIPGGSLVLSAGSQNDNRYLESLPWLKKMAEARKTESKRHGRQSIFLYLLLGALVLGGSIYFAFIRRQTEKR